MSSKVMIEVGLANVVLKSTARPEFGSTHAPATTDTSNERAAKYDKYFIVIVRS